MGSDLILNPPPPDDLPTQVAYLVRRNRELEEEARELRRQLAAALADVEALRRAMTLVRRESPSGE